MSETHNKIARALCDRLQIPATQGTVWAIADELARAVMAERERCRAACVEYRQAFADLPASWAKAASDNASLIIQNAITHGTAILPKEAAE